MSSARTAPALTPAESKPAEAVSAVVQWGDGGDTRTVLLRNSGSRPLRVRGDLLAEGSSWGAGLPCWHEVSLYRCDGGGLALAQRTRRGVAPESGPYRAMMHATMDDVCRWLEGFDATMDLEAGFDVADASLTGTAIALKAASLRDRAERVERAYRAMVGELLYQLACEG